VQRVVNVAYIWYKMVRKNSVQNSETELNFKGIASSVLIGTQLWLAYHIFIDIFY